MQVGEQHLTLAEPLVLLRLRFLDLHDHVGGGEHGVGVGQDLRAGGRELVVADRRAVAGRCLHRDAMPRAHELAHTLGRRRDAVLVVLDFLRDADDPRPGASSLRPGRPIAWHAASVRAKGTQRSSGSRRRASRQRGAARRHQQRQRGLRIAHPAGPRRVDHAPERLHARARCRARPARPAPPRCEPRTGARTRRSSRPWDRPRRGTRSRRGGSRSPRRARARRR